GRLAVAFNETLERLTNHACSDSALLCVIVFWPGRCWTGTAPTTGRVSSSDTLTDVVDAKRHRPSARPAGTTVAVTGRAAGHNSSSDSSRWQDSELHCDRRHDAAQKS